MGKVKKRAVIIGLMLGVALCAPGNSVMAGSPRDADTAATPRTVEMATMTVTAEKREKNVQEIPVSITTLSDMALSDARIIETEDLVRQVPNMHMIKTGNHSQAGFLSIRGITGWMGGEPTVGFYVDDVFYSTFDTQFLDVERIEVLKGPQGTLYGRNTEAGVVNIVSKSPKDYWEGMVSADIGSYNTRVYRAGASEPLVDDTLLFRVSAKQTDSDGYFDNTALGDDTADELDDFSGRVSTRWMPTDQWDITVTGGMMRFRDGNASFAPLDQVRRRPNDVAVDYHGACDYDATHYNLRIGYQGRHFNITSITSHRSEENTEKNDVDFSPMDLMRLDIPSENDLISQEIRFASLDDGGPLEWLAGMYYFAEDKKTRVDMASRQPTPLPAPYPAMPPFSFISDSATDVTGHALFGQASYLFFDRLRLTLGMRYDYEEKDFSCNLYYDPDLSMFGMSPSSVDADDDWSEWLPKLSVDYTFRPGLMAYASVSRGYKSGGFNSLAPAADMSYDPEYTTNYELGVKSAWADNRLVLNMALFHIDWTDQQIEQQAYPQAITKNAGESTSRGFEIEILATPTRGLTLTAGFGYVDATFDDYTDDLLDPVTHAKIGTVDYADNDIPNVPDYTYNLAAQYRSPGGLFTRISLQGVGAFYYDSANTQKEGAYETVDARLGWEWEHYQVYAWGKNIFDTAYATRAFEMGGAYFGRAGDPATFGVSLQARF